MKNPLLLVFLCLALFTTYTLSAQADGQWLTKADIPSNKNRVQNNLSNEKEVLLEINQYLSEHLSVASEFLEYYNSDVQFTIAFEIALDGKLQHIVTLEACKNPIASALIHELQKLERVEPITQNGVAITAQYNIPVYLKKS